MGSNYYGEAKFGGSSSRKGKNNSSDKPNKQPQRGLGVAQLEKIRLHTQLGSANPLPNPNYPFTNPIQEDVKLQSSSFSYTTPTSSSYGFQPAQNMMMGLGDSERANVRYGDSQPTINNIARWNAGNAALNPTQYYQQPYISRNLVDLEAQELVEKKGGSGDSMGSGSRNSGSGGSQELDLELRLSL